MSVDLAPLHRAHVQTLMQRSAAALERVAREHLLIAAGATRYEFLDDRPYPFRINPHFKAWLPLDEHPDCWLKITPGEKPHLFYFQPDDFWHMPPADPAGYWTEQCTISIIRDPGELAALLPPPAQCAIVGEPEAAVGAWVPDNPPALIDYLHFHRAFKTPYEIELMRRASRRAVSGHRAAEAAFRAGASEHGVHQAYLAASGHGDLDLPYGSIVCLNEHAAILHYQHRDRVAPVRHRSLLIDAGAEHRGYAADITRTYGNGDPEFTALLERVAHLEMALADRVRAGQHYPDLHVDAHRGIADILVDLGIVRTSAEAAVATGITRTFFPHGLGHFLGLQVHDVAGHQRDESGALNERPADHPYLRLTRTLEAGNVLTIEPGIYFIDLLLGELADSRHAGAIAWNEIDALRHYGGIRIEDDVRATAAGTPENLSRDAFAEITAA